MATVQGTSGADTLVGSDIDDTFLGGAGADQMTGGDGNDTYYVDSADDTVNEVSGSIRADGYWKGGGTDTVHTNLAEYTLPANVENLQMGGKQGVEPGTGDMFAGKAGVRHGVGNRENNLMQGDGGSEHFEGLDGNDTLLGGGGSDTLDGGNGGDLLDGGSGADVMLGGAGSDTYMVDDAGDVITDVSGIPDYYPAGTGGIDVMKTSLATVNMAAYKDIEEVQLIGDSNLDRSVVGTSSSTRITALDGNDRLEGMGGSDTLYGGGGNDTLAGNAMDGGTQWAMAGDSEIASLYGGAGNDLYVLRNGLSAFVDMVYEQNGGGRDTVEAHSLFYSLNDKFNSQREVEDLWFEGQSAWGNELDNRIVGLGQWYQHLWGGAGQDTLVANAAGGMLDGGEGDDVLESSSASGRDLYRWMAGVDVIRDAGGIDRLDLGAPSQNAQLAFARDGLDMLITRGVGNQCRIEGWFDVSGAHQIEFLVLDDGRSISASELNALLDAAPASGLVLPSSAWQSGRDLSAARTLTDVWRPEALSVSGTYNFPGGWNHYLALSTPPGEAMWRGSDQADTFKLWGDKLPDVWSAGGDDNIEIWDSTTAIRLSTGAGNDAVKTSYCSGRLTLVVGDGSGTDTLVLSDPARGSTNSSLTIELAPGLLVSDLQVRNVQADAATDLMSFELYQPATGDALKVKGLSISGLTSSDSFYEIRDGQQTFALSSVVKPAFVRHDPSQGKVLTSTDAQANDAYIVGSQYLPTSTNAYAYEVSDAGGNDQLVLGTNVVPTAVGQLGEFLYFRQSAQDLQITVYQRNNNNTAYGSASGTVTVKDWFASPQRQIESIQFGSSQGQRVITSSKVQALVDAMASWSASAPPPPWSMKAATAASDLALQYSVPLPT